MHVSSSLDMWKALPPFLQKALLLSGDAGPRLLQLAEELMENLESAARPDLLSGVFADMASFAWEASCFDVWAANVLQQVDSQLPVLPPSLKGFVAACAKAYPADMAVAERFEDALAEGDMGTVKTLLTGRQDKERGNLFWLRFARYMGLRMGDLDWYAGWLRPQDMPPGILMALKAELAFAREEWANAEKLFAAAYAAAPLTDFLVKQGECSQRQGRRKEAQACWQAAFARRPWQVNLLLRLTDALLGLDTPGEQPKGSGKILLYTWNHARDLDMTLAALAASELGDAGLVLLDNGSTDNTQEVIATWKERLGKRLETLTLPTNVGAPAARNWLLGVESVRGADWVVFLDDDAVVPPDWLRWFGAALDAYPEAEIVGCRVVEQAVPLTVQSVDLHFDAGGREVERGRAKRHLSGGSVLVPHALESADFGQFSYVRPCMSVTGCCHLFTRKSIERTGLFDLRFSPSQFDDFERDLRAGLAGSVCVYQGHLAVRHSKRSGGMSGMSGWLRANVGGNMFKLWSSYTNDQVELLIAEDNLQLWADLSRRLERTGL